MRNVALALAATLLALVAAELSVRMLGVGPEVGLVYAEMFQLSANPRLRYQLRPGAPDGAHRISDVGHRGEDVARTPPPRTFRIAALGDSVTFGFGVEREQAWPEVLGALLEERGALDTRRFEVLNLGVTGYDVVQVAEQARVLAKPHAPELLVYGYVLNDPQDFSFEGNALARIASHESGCGAHAWGSRLRLVGLLRALSGPRRYAHTQQGTLVREDGSPVGLALENDPAVDAALLHGDFAYFRLLHQRALPRLRQGLEALAAAAGDVPVLLAIFPVFPDEAPYPLLDVHGWVRAEAERVGFRVLDLLSAYEASADRFGPRRHVGNVLHPNAFGYRVAARALLNALLAEGLIELAEEAELAHHHAGGELGAAGFARRAEAQPDVAIGAG